MSRGSSTTSLGDELTRVVVSLPRSCSPDHDHEPIAMDAGDALVAISACAGSPASDHSSLLSRSTSQAPTYGAVAPLAAAAGPLVAERPFFPVGAVLSEVLLLLGSIVAVACWSIAGNACRIALIDALVDRHAFFTDYEYFGPNCIGCFAMGLVGAAATVADQDRFAPFVFRGVLVGFCGSLTTFSSWVVDLVNRPTAAGAFAELVCGVTIPFAFFHFGRDAMRGLLALGGGCASRWGRQRPRGSSSAAGVAAAGAPPSPWIWRANAASLAVFVAAAVAVPVAVSLASGRVPPYELREAVLAPAGAVPRYLLAQLLNNRERLRRVPVGTLTANLLAVLLAVLLNALGHRRGEAPHNWKLVTLTGICGALSTVSTWVREICGYADQDRRRMAYGYGAATLLPSIAIAAVGRAHNFM